MAGDHVSDGVAHDLLFPVALKPIGVEFRSEHTAFGVAGGSVVEVWSRPSLAVRAIRTDLHELEALGDGGRFPSAALPPVLDTVLQIEQQPGIEAEQGLGSRSPARMDDSYPRST